MSAKKYPAQSPVFEAEPWAAPDRGSLEQPGEEAAVEAEEDLEPGEGKQDIREYFFESILIAFIRHSVIGIHRLRL